MSPSKGLRPDRPRRRDPHPPRSTRKGTPKRTVGRPPTPQSQVQAYLQALREGHGPTTAIGRALCTMPTLLAWRKDEDFLKQENQALAEWADKLTQRVTKDAEADAELALKVLARRVPKDWSPSERHEVSGEGGGPVAFRVILTEKEEDEGKESGNG